MEPTRAASEQSINNTATSAKMDKQSNSEQTHHNATQQHLIKQRINVFSFLFTPNCLFFVFFVFFRSCHFQCSMLSAAPASPASCRGKPSFCFKSTPSFSVDQSTLFFCCWKCTTCSFARVVCPLSGFLAASRDSLASALLLLQFIFYRFFRNKFVGSFKKKKISRKV